MHTREESAQGSHLLWASELDSLMSAGPLEWFAFFNFCLSLFHSYSFSRSVSISFDSCHVWALTPSYMSWRKTEASLLRCCDLKPQALGKLQNNVRATSHVVLKDVMKFEWRCRWLSSRFNLVIFQWMCSWYYIAEAKITFFHSYLE